MKPLPTIGFDRYITRSWLDLALAIAAGEKDRAELTALLAQDITGVEARSKTSIILNRMWLSPHPSLVPFVAEGVAHYQRMRDVDTFPLHWGMALMSHPFFSSIADSMGRLLKLHGEVTSAQVTRRLKEQYGDRPTILRAAEAVLQTLLGWGVIKEMDGKGRVFVAVAPIAIQDRSLAVWLAEAAIVPGGKSMPVSATMNALYPFILPTIREQDVVGHARIKLVSMGAGEMVLSVV
jgi:hypothetical protein